METSTNSELLTPRQAAEFLGVKPQTLSIWRITGRHGLPFLKIGDSVKYSRAALDEWKSARTFTSTAEANAALSA
jgi:excisionase family DNA binding protein